MKRKNIMKWGCGILAVLSAAALLLIGSFVYITRYRIADIDSSTSNDSQYKVIFQSVGEPDWPFGYSHARIVLKRDNRLITKYKFDVANDGGILLPQNWRVEWLDTCVRIVISGEEQDDMLYTFHFEGTVDAETLPNYGISSQNKPLPIGDLSDLTVDISSLASVNERNESVFAVSVEDLIESYNGVYQQSYGQAYLTATASDEWSRHSEHSPRFGYDATEYTFSEDKAIWSMPTISIYASDHNAVYEIRVTFDHHSYQEHLYSKYKNLCSCLLKMACPELSEEEIDEAFCALWALSEKNFFGDHYRYGDPERPPLSDLLQYGNVGLYCFFGSGSVEICMIPLTPMAVDSLEAEGVVIRNLQYCLTETEESQ